MDTKIKSMTVYPDASGAPAVVISGDFTYAMDFIGGAVTCNLIGGPSFRGGQTKAVALATHAYFAELRKRMGFAWDKWHTDNLSLYADEDR